MSSHNVLFVHDLPFFGIQCHNHVDLPTFEVVFVLMFQRNNSIICGNKISEPLSPFFVIITSPNSSDPS